MATNTTPFPPPPTHNQPHVTISALTGGFITLDDHFFVHPADPTAKRTVPSLAFLITHPNPPAQNQSSPSPSTSTSRTDLTPFNILFDLGLRSSKARYPEPLQKHLENRAPYTLTPSVLQQLEAGGLKSEDIDMVILSHVHYDHHGDPEDFPSSLFVVGSGALNVVAHGLEDGKGSHQHFQRDLFKRNKVVELPAIGLCKDVGGREVEWRSLGPFPAALNLFGDGAVFVVDMPGHLPGHVNLLCRTGNGKWICLCGDAFHDSRLLSGEKEIGTWNDGDGGILCIHVDKEEAKSSIERLRELQRVKGVDIELIAAHDEEWLERNKECLFPGRIE